MPPAVAPPGALYAGRVDSDTLKLTWKAAKGADGYVVLRYDPAKKAYEKVATVGKKATSWTDKATKANKTYRYKMRSYDVVGGKRVYSALTYAVSSKTHSPAAKKTNVQSIDVNRSATIGLGQVKQIYAEAEASHYTTYEYPRPVSTKLYYSASNSRVKVSASGKVTGLKAGTATVTIRSHNGRLAKVKVTVKDFAHPKGGFDYMSGYMMPTLVEAKRAEILNIASYFSQHPEASGGYICLDENDNLLNHANIDMGSMRDYIYKFLYSAPYPVEIAVYSTQIEFQIPFPDADGAAAYESLKFFYDHDLEDQDAASSGMDKVAPRWFFSTFAGH
ncbi:MAG: Ig-like domain-containing protein [Actinomycetia bacterium]|nr:Ig-like domain-containing protein [Actinomycetes bacterium]